MKGVLQLSTEDLLTWGSDSRSRATDGTMSRYGCRPYPRDATPFGSCTASSPTQEVYEAAAELHYGLRSAGSHSIQREIRNAYGRIVEDVRRELLLDQVPGVEIALTPSGTDAEYLATMLAIGVGQRDLANIVVGPREVGSGSELAAACRHFDDSAPRRERCEKGSPVNEDVAARVHVDTIHLRDGEGRVREPDDLDAEVERVAERELALGRRVLLHIVAHSKTGVHAPTLRLARELQHEHPDSVDVIVDAAQGRLSRKGLREALHADWLVLFTGSKFYGGPPFSGALLVPSGFAPARRHAPPIPVEFSDYFSRWELPDAWGPFVANIKPEFNLGLLLRWTAAARAIGRYYEVPPAARFAVLRRFEEFVPAALRESRWLEIDSVEPVRFPDGAERLLESKTTVFPFRVKIPDGSGGGYMKKQELRRVGFLLNRDLSHLERDSSTAASRQLRPSYHIGQPVFEGDEEHAAVLRLALGAALVSSVGLDHHLGKSLDERLEWLERQVTGTLAKLDWIAERFPDVGSGQA